MRRIVVAGLTAVLVGPFNCANAGGNAPAGQAIAKEKCAACHGADGNGTPEFKQYPKLAGQHSDYLVKALKDYASGARNNPIMAANVSTLSGQDVEDVAAWFASQSGGVYTIKYTK